MKIFGNFAVHAATTRESSEKEVYIERKKERNRERKREIPVSYCTRRKKLSMTLSCCRLPRVEAVAVHINIVRALDVSFEN